MTYSAVFTSPMVSFFYRFLKYSHMDQYFVSEGQIYITFKTVLEAKFTFTYTGWTGIRLKRQTCGKLPATEYRTQNDNFI